MLDYLIDSEGRALVDHLGPAFVPVRFLLVWQDGTLQRVEAPRLDWGRTSDEMMHRFYLDGQEAARGLEGLPLALFVSTLAWGSHRYDSTLGRRVSEYPDRFEMISISGQASDGRGVMAGIHLNRGPRRELIAGEIDRMYIGKPDSLAKVESQMAVRFFAGWRSAGESAGPTRVNRRQGRNTGGPGRRRHHSGNA